MSNFVRFIDSSLPGERLINLDAIESCVYSPNATPPTAEIGLISGEFFVLQDWTAIAVWSYLSSVMRCQTIVIGEKPKSLELEELEA